MKFEINSIADLIANFIPHGVKEIEKNIEDNNINHPVTIGSMYEGLTKDTINASIFSNLNLNIITNSHIAGSKKEFDVLLIEGNASKLPYSDRYICNPEQVLAIIQVKKNLYSKDLIDSYDNLKEIVDLYNNIQLKPFMYQLLRDGFRSICSKDITQDSQTTYTEEENAIYHSLLIDAKLPIRIVWGYNGFKSELSFRESFIKFLELNVSENINDLKKYFGPHNFPSLIINDGFSMIKCNGMPFGQSILNHGIWSFFNTSSKNPFYFLLELLWTRLSYQFSITTDIFGEDLTVDQVNLFLDAKYGEFETKPGWHYNAFTPNSDFFKVPPASSNWEPIQINELQYEILMEIGRSGKVLIDEKLSDLIFQRSNISIDEFINSFKTTGLVYVIDNEIRYLTDQCECVILPNGRIFAADNKSNRLTNWALNQL